MSSRDRDRSHVPFAAPVRRIRSPHAVASRVRVRGRAPRSRAELRFDGAVLGRLAHRALPTLERCPSA